VVLATVAINIMVIACKSVKFDIYVQPFRRNKLSRLTVKEIYYSNLKRNRFTFAIKMEAIVSTYTLVTIYKIKGRNI